MPQPDVAERVRNFCIIAHIDHGKTTLADRMLELTGLTKPGAELLLDDMDLERERGITIKASAVRMHYRARDGNTYILNLIDTPGHVDFSYEVSRALTACDGALLVVDAVQGIQAQTVANYTLARQAGLVIIPVVNKIDLPNADPDRVLLEMHEMLNIDPDEALIVSAKFGTGIDELMEAIVQRIPPPDANPSAPLKALIFDSTYDDYRGVVVYVCIKEGAVRHGMEIQLMSSKRTFEVMEVGYFQLRMVPTDELRAGDVGYIMAGIKDVRDARIGDTITDAKCPAAEPLLGYREPKPMVFCGFYPAEGGDYERLRDALEKLRLNDASLTFQPESSPALGFGFRCGFLGLLHMEIIQERIEREFDVPMVIVAPSVVYRVRKRDGEVVEVDNPAKLPPASEIAQIEEPMVDLIIITPEQYVGACMELAQERRGRFQSMEHSLSGTVTLRYRIPFAEILLDFYDLLKSRTRGYATMDYQFVGFEPSELVKLDILINGKRVDALSFITHREKAYYRGRELVRRLKEVLPRQLFEVRIQAAIGSRVIASERIPPLRKDVTAKCYGGDVTRKRKLLEKQKAGKKRLKQIGSVQIPQEAFLSVLRIGKS